MKLINKTANGQLTYCTNHKSYHLEFGNIFLTVSQEELQNFANYVNSIDFAFYSIKNKNSANQRKILLHLDSAKVMFAIHKNEFIELRNLLSLQSKNKIIHNGEFINLSVVLN